MIDTKTIIQALYYVLSKLKTTATKLKLVKMIYLADKCHLVKYGRTVTGDSYFAMEYGPVGSTLKDVLEFNEFTLSSEELKYASKLLEKASILDFIYKPADIDLDMLSDTDKEALDFVINNFGSWKPGQLVDFTHKYPEWKQHEYLFQNGLTKREDIKTEELLSVLDEDLNLFGVEKEHIEESRAILMGMYS